MLNFPMGENPKVSVEGSMLSIEETRFEGPEGIKQPAAQSLDLTPYQGGMVRLFLNASGEYEINRTDDYYHIIAEAELPETVVRLVDSGEVDEVGDPVMAPVEEPLDLSAVDITVYPMP
jgi:hypothetical protein